MQAVADLPPAVLSPDFMDDELSPLLALADRAVTSRSRIAVLSLWKHLPLVPLFASHLHLKWAGQVDSLPLSPRIGIFPFFRSDMELLSKPLYSVTTARASRKNARTRRFSSANTFKGDLYPDWEQAVDRRGKRLGHMTLPASSFISIDRVSGTGDIKSGHRQVIGQLAPRGQLRPQFLVPSRVEVTRQLVRAFEDLDLVLVNVQSLRGKQLTSSIAHFLSVIPRTVPLLIVASSPADLIAIDALLPPSGTLEVLSDTRREASVQVRPINHDRVMAERQFCYAIDGLAEKSDMIARLVAQAQRAWWATRQSMSVAPPPEALAFETLYGDLVSRSPGIELELLEGAKQLILQEAGNSAARDERREAVIEAAFHDSSARSVMVLARSDSAARELRTALAQYLDVSPQDLAALGIQVQNVFSAWPSASFDVCVVAGYFGTSTIDMLFASKAAKLAMVVDPIEARIAIWDIEKRFCEVAGLPGSVMASLRSLTVALTTHASPSSDPISLSSLSGERGSSSSASTMTHHYGANASYVCICFADGATRQVAANARFEVLGRKRLQLKSVTAKELQIGDQVILVRDDERAAFSGDLLQLMDQGRLKEDSQTRSAWISMVRAVRASGKISASLIKKRMENAGIEVDLTTIRSWLPSATSDDCGVPESEAVFLAFAAALEIALPVDMLQQWYLAIKRLRIHHRVIGRELGKAIRGAYLGRLDAVTIARMEREWGVQARELLEAARVAVVDDVIPLSSETS
jgi:hypothetical protein